METIYIPQLLKAPEKCEVIEIEEFIPGLETLTPLRGIMKVRHGGNYLEILLQAEVIVTLTCDRCLRQYNHRLSLNTSEVIWLDKNSQVFDNIPSEREILVEELEETLPPNGYFEPANWLYEQLSLAMPLRQLCSQNCQPPDSDLSVNEPLIDKRWASLQTLMNYEL